MGFVTAEKIEPSPITIMGEINQAIQVEKSFVRGGRAGLRDLLSLTVTNYNRMVTNKRHRIDSGRKALILNLLFGFNLNTFSSL